MFYEHSQEIAKRVDNAIKLIETGLYSTRTLAAALGVSVPTASRLVCALRQRGYTIKSVKNGRSWVYRIDQAETQTTGKCEARNA